MSTLYQVFDDVVHTEAKIVDQYENYGLIANTLYSAAVCIQKVYRGYIVRKHLKKKHAYATTIQKVVRGWRVRFHLPDRLNEHYDYVCLVHYNKNATKIQAVWRGYWVRLKINVKTILTEKQQLAHTMDLIQDEIRQKFIENEGLGKRQLEKALNTLYDKHHLLRTHQIEGIFSQHGSKELSELEKILSSAPWKNHMMELRKCYNKYQKERPYQYLFDCKHPRKDEDLYRLRDKSKDKDFDYTHLTDTGENNFVTKLNAKPKIPDSIDIGPYSPPIRRVLRIPDNSKNINEHDFDLHVLKMIAKEADIPPYYIDFWYGKCENHNLPE